MIATLMCYVAVNCGFVNLYASSEIGEWLCREPAG